MYISCQSAVQFLGDDLHDRSSAPALVLTVTPMEYFEALIKLCICTVKRKLDSLEEHAEEKYKAVVIIIDCKWRKGT